MLAYLGYLIKQTPKVSAADYIQILIFVTIALTLIFAIYAQVKNSQNTDSAAYLNTSIELLNKAYVVLSDGAGGVRCDRITWVTAARLLSRSEIIAKNISVDSHRDIFNSEKDYQRHRLNQLLSIDGKPLPIEFFFGSGYINGDIGASAYATLENGEIEWIPTNIVSQVYRFKEYPRDYNDPLDGSTAYNEAELQSNISLSDQDGVCGYIRIREHLLPTDYKKVFQLRPKSQGGNVVIDSKKINTLEPLFTQSRPLKGDEIA